MRKAAILLAVLLAASLSTSADAAKRKPAAKPDPAIAANQNTAKFLRDAFHPLGFKSAAPAKPAKKAKKSKKKGKKGR